MYVAEYEFHFFRKGSYRVRIVLFREKEPKSFFTGGLLEFLRKFSIICEQIIGLEDTILPLRTSTTVSIVSSKLRKPNQRFDFLKFTLLGALPDYFHTNQCLFRRGALRAPVGINVTTVGAHQKNPIKL